MAVNSATVQNILKHAKAAREVWHDFLLIVPEKDKQAFKEAFHLRPTSAGITIVSTLPLAPMRGIDVSLADLKNSIKELFLNFKKFVADNEDTALDELKKFGFKKRTNKNSLEEDIQAKIINNMIRCTEQDDCFHFVASELTIEKGRRFDIVALRGDTLYIIDVDGV